MKILRRTTLTLVLIGLLAATLFFNGCGRKEAASEGCPSNSYVANSDDIMTGPADATLSVSGGSLVGGGCSGGGTFLYSPLTFVVKDANSNPKNNVCITLYTDGFWYSNLNYSTLVTGEGPMNKVNAVTDANGRITLYWSTENLPSANPPSGTTAGTDIGGASWVQAYTGVLSKTYNVSWTVSGCAP